MANGSTPPIESMQQVKHAAGEACSRWRNAQGLGIGREHKTADAGDRGVLLGEDNTAQDGEHLIGHSDNGEAGGAHEAEEDRAGSNGIWWI